MGRRILVDQAWWWEMTQVWLKDSRYQRLIMLRRRTRWVFWIAMEQHRYLLASMTRRISRKSWVRPWQRICRWFRRKIWRLTTRDLPVLWTRWRPLIILILRTRCTSSKNYKTKTWWKCPSKSINCKRSSISLRCHLSTSWSKTPTCRSKISGWVHLESSLVYHPLERINPRRATMFLFQNSKGMREPCWKWNTIVIHSIKRFRRCLKYRPKAPK